MVDSISIKITNLHKITKDSMKMSVAHQFLFYKFGKCLSKILQKQKFEANYFSNF